MSKHKIRANKIFMIALFAAGCIAVPIITLTLPNSVPIASVVAPPIASDAIVVGTQPQSSQSSPTKVRTPDESLDDAATTLTVAASAETITPPSTPTLVPRGTFVLRFYVPLIMTYDPSLWVDKSNYGNDDIRQGYLEGKSLSTCQLWESAGRGLNPGRTEHITLGSINYSRTTYDSDASGALSAVYIDRDSLAEFDYSKGAPILILLADASEWSDCLILAEQVLATLQVPS
jgi:hypothetical protein